MELVGRRISVYKEAAQETTKYEGEIIAFRKDDEFCFTIMQDNGIVTVPFPTVCRIHVTENKD